MQLLLNDNWKFAKMAPDSALQDALSLPEGAWRAVDLPHDWLISQSDDFYEDGDGWYRRTLNVDDLSGAWLLRFDGVYMDCDVLLNGAVAATHRYGYTAFDVPLTGRLRLGENELMVRVRHRAPNSRWYSGAGIFRDVTLYHLPARHIAPDGVYVTTSRQPDGGWRVSVAIEMTGEGRGEPLRLRLTDPDGERLSEVAVEDTGDALYAEFCVENPALWSCESPKLYALECQCGQQRVALRVGLRTLAFDPDRGFMLNGVVTKLHGVCLHHDLGALGSAFNAAAFRRQMRLMKRMGANALRTSHNPPAARALDICDEEGVLVIDEALDMWERPKTKNDYARFFPDCWQSDVASWVRSDRSHPCVIMWSIGNEILDTHASPRGYELTRMLRDAARSHDPAGGRAVTFGSNYMPWENTQRCAELLDAVGYNYAEHLYAAHHAAHPDWVIYGSETASTLSSRGVYHFPKDVNVLSEEDLQCSALGNSATSWGTQDMRACLIDDMNTPYSMGQFLWSGIDYIGEPTPYHTRSCYFGMADTAGFPKDFFYQVKAVWNPEPMAHIGVNWDWNPGQTIDVPVYTNGACCELWLNGVSLGRKAVDIHTPSESLPVWRVPYAPGTLLARAWDADDRVIAEDARHSHGDAARLVLRAEREHIRADGEDCAFIEITAVDAGGRPVENAANRVAVSVEGPAYLRGLDNGDSTDPDGYKVNSRCLFGGRLLAIVGAKDVSGEAVVRVEGPGLEGASLTLELCPAAPREGSGRVFADAFEPVKPLCRVPARRIALAALDGNRLSPEHPEARFAARLLPENADDQPIAYRVVNAAGIESPCAKVVPIEGGVKVVGKGDGEVFLRATCANGAPHARVISQLELSLTGFGPAGLDPYGFVSAGLYNLSHGTITAGNDKGVSFDREGESIVGFTDVDFGPVGSDEITLPVFALNGDPHVIELWLGDPKAGGRLLASLPYQKPCIWNTYQPETWKLPERLTGAKTICFRMTRKLHLKGFQFTRQSRAWLPLMAGEADAVYGDSFTRNGAAVRGIGNNVTLLFENMDFEGAEAAALAITGATPLEVNSVQLRLTDADGRTLVQECPFRGDGGRTQRFQVRTLPGVCSAAFVFLPGCQFDFEGFRFERETQEQ